MSLPRETTPADPTSASEFESATVVDASGRSLGPVRRVFVTSGGGAPSWVAVRVGLLGPLGASERLVPLEGSVLSGGELRVPFEKDTISGAPEVPAPSAVTREHEDELYRYYGIKDNAEPDGGIAAPVVELEGGRS